MAFDILLLIFDMCGSHDNVSDIVKPRKSKTCTHPMKVFAILREG